MLVPISWLKEFVNFDMKPADLMWKLTEVGLTSENSQKVGDDTIIDVEITPNRPDWLSIVGIAREVAAITGKRVNYPKLPQIPPKSADLPITISNNFKLCPRYTALTLKNITLKESPQWLKNRLIKVGLRPINNLVDITNYVMFELGNPIHVFDYDKLTNGKLTLTLSKGEEKFVSVDNKAYSLPKDAIIFKSGNEVVDLCGIKGGLNSGISNSTKNVLILVAIYDGVYIRKVCQKLKLFSEASHIFERGANAGGTIDALKRVVSLTQKLAGGAVASDLIDKKEFKFEPWKSTLSLNKLEKVLGVTLPTKTVLNLLSRLNLNPVQKKESIICTIPTYRGDLKIEEDLIEEVARLYGYNNFPLTLPEAKLPVKKVPYFYDWKWEIKLKNLMKAAGYTEALTLSLISEDLINNVNLEQATHVRLANPVSRDYEFMRTSLLPSLLEGVKLNSKEQRIKLFEFNKVYLGSLGKTKEPQMLSGVEVGGNYETLKGMIDLLCERLNFQNISIENVEGKNFWHPAKTAILKYKELIVGTFGALSPQVLENLGIKQSVYAFELDSEKLKQASQSIVFKPLPKYPPQIEDITFILPEETYVLDINHEIAKSNPLISSVSYSEKFKNAYTFRIEYKHPDRTLTDSEVEEARKAAIKAIEKKFNGKVK